eukprot:scaffold562902_cov32-Prasinocladus_malaysianus.AAC.1
MIPTNNTATHFRPKTTHFISTLSCCQQALRIEISAQHTDDMQDLGPLERVVVGHDNSGRAPSWHLDKVVVTARGTSETTVFPCRGWLSTERGGGLIE